MSNSLVALQGTAEVSIPANESIALLSVTETQVFKVVGFPNYPEQNDLESTFTGYKVLGPYSAATTLIIQAGAAEVQYQIGVAPVVFGSNYQGTPTTQNSAATLTTAKVMSGLITCTQATGATIAVLLPTGANMELAAQFDVGDYFDWVFVNNSVAAADTVTITNAASNNNINGPAIIAAATSAIFRSYKTATDTFATYRIA
jgi:hypothetical protein